MPVKSPIKWFGGKGVMVAKLLPMMPPCRRYVEPFGGGASVLLARDPVEVEVYNDVDGGLVNFFRVLADVEQFDKFYRRVALLPYSRELYNECHTTWADQSEPIERAARWFVVARQSFGGVFGNSWGFVVTHSVRLMSSTCSGWLSAIERLPEVHARLQRVQIENYDWRSVLETYDTSDTLFYCDPPYVHGTRSDKRYSHELSDQDHAELVDRLLQVEGSIVLSGYRCETYSPLESAGWKRVDFQTACFAAGRTRHNKIRGNGSAMRMQSRVESVWIKPTKMIGGLFDLELVDSA